MMKTKSLLLSLIAFSLMSAVIITSCTKDNNGPKVNISSTNGTESHNMGENCMKCHVNGGEGEGYFTVAGTVYDTTFSQTVKGGVVRLYTGANGSGKYLATVFIDAKGNFYTTKNIDVASGVYPRIESQAGSFVYMKSKCTNGACNSCHNGNTTNRLHIAQ